ncbi:MAG TPA: hypothetical protein VKU02_18425 [Gemmataceae bacterium]|nr:hypothetical protein [Gemmataceae bacterium]
MALPVHIALVSDGLNINSSDMTQVAAALSKQVQRDFEPIWDVDATVDGFGKLEDIPTGYWPIIVMRNVQGAAGYHEDKNGQPFAVVEYGDQWSITASHECLEMLADPFGQRLVEGNLLDQAIQLGLPPGRVQYLVEICDPSESAQFGYQVNGIQVSDFYTPSFFDPIKATGVRYSFTGAIDGPRKVLDGGYISWEDPVSTHWSQLRMFPDEISSAVPHVVDLSQQTAFEEFKKMRNIRSAVDRVTKFNYREGLRGPALMAARVSMDTSAAAREARAAAIREQIGELRQKGTKATRSRKAKGK